MNLKIDRQLRQIRKLSDSGDFIQAEITVNALLSEYPKNAKARKLRNAVLAAYDRSLPEGLLKARVLGDSGRQAECQPIAERVFAEHPDCFEAAFLIGRVKETLGDIEEAKAWFTKCLEIHPGYYKAHNDLGLIYQRQKDYPSAFAHFAKAIENAPHWSGPLNNLGSLLNVVDKREEALMALDQALNVDPNDPRAHINRGNTHWAMENKDLAIKDHLAAIRIAPQMYEPYANLAEIHERSNDAAAIREILELADRNGIGEAPSIQMRRGEFLVRERDFEGALTHLNRIDLSRLSETHQQVVARLKSRCHDKLGNAQKAFDNFQLMNDLNMRSFHGMESDADRYFERVKRKLEDTRAMQDFFWTTPYVPENEEKIAFLVGFPRSGTTLLDTILSSHPRILTAEEKPMLENAMTEAGGEGLAHLDSLTDAQIQEIREQYIAELGAQFEGDTSDCMMIDKMPLNLTHAAFINRVFPEARFIFAVRDPGDCVLSCFMQSFQLNDAMANFGDINRSAEIYDAVMQLWQEYRSLLPLQVYQNKYEDLVSDMKGCCQPMLEFLGLEWDDALLEYQKVAGKRTKISTPSYSQVVQPLYKDASGRWKRYERQMQSALPHLEVWRQTYGYT